MYVKRNNVRIKRKVFDLHDVTVDSKKVVLFEYAKPLLSSYLKLESLPNTSRGTASSISQPLKVARLTLEKSKCGS